MLHSRAVSLALVGLFGWVTGCSTYTRISIAEVGDHGRVRVTTIDGERETMRDPRVEGDSIWAHEKRESDRDFYDPIVVIPLDEVATLEAVGVDEVGTVLTVVGTIAGSLFLIVAAVCLFDEDAWC